MRKPQLIENSIKNKVGKEFLTPREYNVKKVIKLKKTIKKN